MVLCRDCKLLGVDGSSFRSERCRACWIGSGTVISPEDDVRLIAPCRRTVGVSVEQYTDGFPLSVGGLANGDGPTRCAARGPRVDAESPSNECGRTPSVGESGHAADRAGERGGGRKCV